MDLGVADRKRENKRQVFVNAGRSTTGDVLADDDAAWPRGHRRNAGTQRVSTTLRPHAFQDCFTWEEYQHQYHSGLTLPMYEAFHGLQLPSVKELIRQLHVPGPDELRHILAQEVI
jgi:hypothetical protein